MKEQTPTMAADAFTIKSYQKNAKVSQTSTSEFIKTNGYRKQ